MKETKKKSLNLFRLSAILYYFAAIMNFISGHNHSMGIMWLCLGSVFLFLGSVNAKKSAENEENKENNDQK